MIKTIAAFDGRCAKVCGPARSGKTEALVQRCVTLLGANVAPESIFVEVSTAFAAQAFRRRLRAALGSARAAAEAVVVETALDACVRVLDTPEARTATGRIPRLLTPAEYNFFLEDMKTLGTPIRAKCSTAFTSSGASWFPTMSGWAPKKKSPATTACAT